MSIEWNKVTWYSKLAAVILFVATFFLGFWLGMMKVEKVYIEVPHIVHRNAPQAPVTLNPVASMTQNSEVSAGSACHENTKYFVVEKGITNGAGTDFLIKYKSAPNQHFDCNYIVEKNDLEIKNQEAEYFSALENNFLILDSGTGPDPRMLIVYDLTKRAKVFSDTYSRPLTVKDNKVDYWTEIPEKVTQANCSKFAEYENGAAAAIDTHVILDLSTLTKRDLSEHRCAYRQ